MANPARARNLAAAVVTAAVVSILVGAALPYEGKGFTPRFVFLMGGLVGITFGGVLLGIFWDATRRYARLTAGKGVIARWTIDSAHWERFRQLSKAWDQGKGVRRNNANLDQKPSDRKQLNGERSAFVGRVKQSSRRLGLLAPTSVENGDSFRSG
jgi:hypothetical protein